ncbi:hypothetical protein [Pontiella sulfatireligans]|uniref:LITAF domain-containing protein n=1 Tax=Pontiella sulfatireligans TaxID=2750658 RepID=A0A6C2UU72_9BACT|nr:hypothetical protein [Pontiella sulfatireligans]VGO22707.1 hypothetical protein SCARR_04803 [Pontiella sulfatireligans]
MKTARFYCADCDTVTKCEARTPSHILHLLLSIITAGLWVIVWVLLILKPLAWRCASCGSSRIRKYHELTQAIKDVPKKANPIGALIGLAIGIGLGFWYILTR